MRCVVCRKRLPEAADYCAYCGAQTPAAPEPLTFIALEWSTLRWVLVGLALGAPSGLLFWLLAGALAGWPLDRRVTLGLLSGALAGGTSGLLHSGLFWPLRFQPRLILDHWRLAAFYGAGSGLTLVAGGAPIGLTVLLLGWHTNQPSVAVVAAGMAAGMIGLVVGVPISALTGVATGLAVSRLSRRLRGPLGVTLACGLAWVNGGAAGGAAVGALVALRSELNPATGAYWGAVIQSLLCALLLPIALRLVRRLFIARSNLP